MKKILALLVALAVCLSAPGFPVRAEEEEAAGTEPAEMGAAGTEPAGTEMADAPEGDSLGITAPSAVLMEASTGTVVLEKNPHEKLPPASVTKIMTLLLIFDSLSQGKIRLEDSVTTSAYAASMGGSQVFLEEGETQSVETMIKCIAVASANDASVAMAEHIAGTESLFVDMMNQRAKELGMNDTQFVNCCGLDAEGHLTSAYDIALMSRELITKYPQIHTYSTIWMENITHTTEKGTTEFGLTNTNKLVRHYEYTTGLKTGSTSLAKFCISATAEKNGMEMIAVIMAAETSKDRTKDAIALLNYGFGKCSVYQEEEAEKTPDIPVKGGIKETAGTAQEELFSYVDTSGANLSSIERKIEMKKSIKAPVKEGQEAGTVRYYLDGKEIGSVRILTTEKVKKMSYPDAVENTVEKFLP